jgi:transposase IS116/IS110/IS902 family protein
MLALQTELGKRPRLCVPRSRGHLQEIREPSRSNTETVACSTSIAFSRHAVPPTLGPSTVDAAVCSCASTSSVSRALGGRAIWVVGRCRRPTWLTCRDDGSVDIQLDPLATLHLIDELDLQIAEVAKELRATGANHPYVPLLMSAPGIGWVLAFTIAAEIGDITRFPNATKLQGYTGLCPKVVQSGSSDRRGPLSKHGPKYLRWALLEATMHALRHLAYSERYQRTKKRLGKQRGAKVAQIEVARRLTHVIWHMLTNNEHFNAAAPGRRRFSSGGLTAL